jgi:molecular chaperone GrpE
MVPEVRGMSAETPMAGETTPVAGDTPEPVESPSAAAPAPGDQDPGSASGTDPQASGSSRIAELDAQLEALRSENESLRSQYMRIAADFDNFRKRQSRDHEELRLQITSTTLGEILPVVDNFDRARQQLNPQHEEAQTIHRSYQGLYRQLVEVFKQLGVSPMRVEGEPFDPNLHEAVLREESEHHPEDVVIEELQRGYHINGKVLRHALVKVSMGPGPSQQPPADTPPEAPADEGGS